MKMVLLLKIFRYGMLLVGLLPTLTFSFGTPANTANYSDNGLKLVQQTRSEQQHAITGQSLHVLSSLFDIEESAEEDLNDNVNTTVTGSENQDHSFVLWSGLNTSPGTPLHLVRYYILYCCPKIPSSQS
ncbi:hypothetical protein [Fulvivirga kasyanovii]|uniref:Uncharacterized protein n=1 Tax=Fulvivirga kasyanovii TaxID=396812 RepID=A0ABW9RX82_9BACT|nr:hypothetical protein [Fulvivirga kasyanovii]MTI28832.1 hypothetical protein [Fulvivirga kasyanovii]